MDVKVGHCLPRSGAIIDPADRGAIRAAVLAARTALWDRAAPRETRRACTESGSASSRSYGHRGVSVHIELDDASAGPQRGRLRALAFQSCNGGFCAASELSAEFRGHHRPVPVPETRAWHRGVEAECQLLSAPFSPSGATLGPQSLGGSRQGQSTKPRDLGRCRGSRGFSFWNLSAVTFYHWCRPAEARWSAVLLLRTRAARG
ncbi:hypothetical protein RA8CHR_00577 [Variovorax sp. RA8]|nr:hypothetical protein RA8CHR_00577 [Variovorax sp. RA8]